MNIIHITEDKKRFMDLLLLGDEQQDMIERYLSDSDVFALYDGDLRAVCAVAQIDDTTCELKNIAVYERYQRQGYGSSLIKYILSYYKNRYKTMLIGTGEIPSILSFYTNFGFEYSHRLPNFFTDNYDFAMFEDGIQLIDMIYLRRCL